MKRQRVYLDTSVIGGCFDSEFAPWSNGLMRDFREAHFTPLVSDLVAAEIAMAPKLVQGKYTEIVALGAEILTESEASDALASQYRAHEIVSEEFLADGLHIALATVAQAKGGDPL